MEDSPLFLGLTTATPFIRSMGLGKKIPGPLGTLFRSYHFAKTKAFEMVGHFLQHSSSSEKYLLSPLVQGGDTFLDRKLTIEELAEEAMGLMFAGAGTTASTLTYLLFALSRNLAVQARLRREVLSLPDTSAAVRQNQYINAVIKGAFRRFPTIMATLPRVLLEPLATETYVLPEGTVVFPEPDRFNRDRWLESIEAMEASLTPFGSGRRNCIGKKLAWEELYLAVNALMWAGIEFRAREETDDEDTQLLGFIAASPKAKRLVLEIARV
ncbi:cytochrome P450 [Fusarium redolens]|uniref:Cytochrome P450 n=1 Tax=Fusarium redolens TaxID=48865 RepID=A0A9P9KED2_FUSRE|nr:cytochrome P450 [Fusarium redolens]KAH7259422.1 cytochrome P450 [Fusarium redolens]